MQLDINMTSCSPAISKNSVDFVDYIRTQQYREMHFVIIMSFSLANCSECNYSLKNRLHMESTEFFLEYSRNLGAMGYHLLGIPIKYLCRMHVKSDYIPGMRFLLPSRN